MGAFTAKDPSNREAFDAHWKRILTNPSVIIRTIVAERQVAGSVLSYQESDLPEVSYWLGKEFWGRDIATRTLAKFLAEVDRRRPIQARVAKDNLPSYRVLVKCGFKVISESKGYANARGREIEELLMELGSPASDK
jgi:RimJ/RimL family protein N-acetyltransferase